MKKSICILTLGCPKNIVDSEYLMASIKKSNLNYYFTEFPENADIIILNTCGFIKDSIDESYNYIIALEHLKNKKTNIEIIIFGCLVARQKNIIRKKFKNIDNFFTILSENDLLNYLKLEFNHLRKQLLTESHYAYLKISDGCNRKCAFCSIPNIKGRYKSIPEKQLINESIFLANNEVKELILIAQETTNYGMDLYNTNFTQLLNHLSQINNIEWIRIMYAHPNTFNEDIVELINNNKNICHYIDIPLQHISDNVLKNMNRYTSSNKIKNIIENIRNINSKIAIRSTFIVGFPGETDKDFQLLYDFLNEYKLERVGVFKYSSEEGTAGYNLPHKISDSVKEERFDALMKLQQQISLKYNESFINKNLRVLVDNISENNLYIARTEFDAPEIDNEVIIKTNKDLKIGDFVDVKIIDAKEYDLIAEY